MRIMYGKIGRSMLLDERRWGPVGGDNEPLYLLLTLARRHPDVDWVISSRYDRGEAELPPNVILPEQGKMTPRNVYKKGVRIYNADAKPWEPALSILAPYFDGADGVVVWCGQMGTSNFPIPSVDDRSRLTEPQDSFLSYCAPTTMNVNRWRDVDPHAREEVWLCPDPRNYLKSRELKWPIRGSIISQYDQVREHRCERYGDPRAPQELGFEGIWDKGTWLSPQRYTYDALEIVGIPDSWTLEYDFHDRAEFGILVNEARAYVTLDRKSVVRDWVLPLLTSSDNIRGKWSSKSAEELGISPEPIYHRDIPSFLGRVKCTFTTPSSGSRWATTKPHEAFRLGAICFFHPEYDKQGHIIPTLEQVEGRDDELAALTRWLRPPTPEHLASYVKVVSESRETYEWLRDAQRRVEQRFIDEQRAVREIERRLCLPV